MSREQNFLVTYGLHNFVTYAQRQGRHAFVIKRQEGQNMIRHAKAIILSSFGDSADIRIA